MDENTTWYWYSNTTTNLTMIDNSNSTSPGSDYIFFFFGFLGLVSFYRDTANQVLIPACEIVTAFVGCVTNIVNVTVFFRQGILVDICTPCLFALGLSDFFVCFSVLGGNLARAPFLFFVTTTNDPVMRTYYINVANIFNTPLHMFALVTAFITTYISLERVVSVTLPFKVKVYLTPRRSCWIIVGFVVASFCLNASDMLSSTYTSTVLTLFNNVTVYYPLIEKRTGLESNRLHFLMILINDSIILMICFVIILVSNTVIAVKVLASTRFRNNMMTPSSSSTTKPTTVDVLQDKDTKKHYVSSPSDQQREVVSKSNKPPQPLQQQSMALSSSQITTTTTTTTATTTHSKRKKATTSSTKELTLIRMMFTLSIIFFVCTAPPTIAGITGQGTTILTLRFLQWDKFCRVLNSCLNIAVYLALSSRYRKELAALCPCLSRDTTRNEK